MVPSALCSCCGWIVLLLEGQSGGGRKVVGELRDGL